MTDLPAEYKAGGSLHALAQLEQAKQRRWGRHKLAKDLAMRSVRTRELNMACFHVLRFSGIANARKWALVFHVI